MNKVALLFEFKKLQKSCFWVSKPNSQFKIKPDKQQIPFLLFDSVTCYISQQKYFFFEWSKCVCKSQNTTLQYFTFNTTKILCELLWLFYKFCTK